MQVIKIGGNVNKDEVINLINRYFSNSKVSIQEEEYEGRYEDVYKRQSQGLLSI